MDSLDRALVAFAHRHSTLGLANHGPMAAEALGYLGHEDAIEEWARGYVAQTLAPRDPGSRFPTGTDRRAWLGHPERTSDWVASFDADLARVGWRDVLRAWLPPLLPGLSCFAAHACIRTAHAVRSLEGLRSAPRLHELAEGLGEWAARYRTLPGRPGDSPSPLLPSQAIHRVEPLAATDQKFSGTIATRLEELDEVPTFRGVIDLVDGRGDPAELVSDLTRTAVRLYLANVERGRGIEFLHTVTGTTALRPLLPYLEPANQTRAIRYAWQLVAGMYVAAGDACEPTAIAPCSEPIPALIDRAVATGNDHAIKFAQACLVEHRETGDPAFLTALGDAVDRGEILQAALREFARRAGEQEAASIARRSPGALSARGVGG